MSGNFAAAVPLPYAPFNGSLGELLDNDLIARDLIMDVSKLHRPSDTRADTQSKTARDDTLDIFISYSRRDSLDFAKQLAKALEALGHTPVMDLVGISGGEDWQERLGKLIVEADTVLFVLSPESAESPICAWEVDEAKRLSKRILPVLPQSLTGLTPPKALERLNYIHFYAEPSVPDSGFGHGLAKLHTALNADVGWLREHRNILMRAEAWEAKGRDPDRLMRGSLLAEAQEWRANKPDNAPDLTPTQRAFLDACRQAEETDKAAAKKQLEEMKAAQDARERALQDSHAALEQAKRAQNAREVAQQEAVAASKRAEAEARKAETHARTIARRTKVGLIAALSFALIAGGFGWYARQQQQEAVAAKEEADAAKDAAEDAKTQATQAANEAKKSEARTKQVTAEAQFTQSGLLAKAASELTDWKLGRDAGTAVLLALEGLPDKTSAEASRQEWNASRTARIELGRALRNLRERDVLVGHTKAVTNAVFSSDESRILTTSRDSTARVWDALTGKEIQKLEGHTKAVTSAVFSSDESRILTASRDSTARVWDALTGKEIQKLEGHTKAVTSAVFSSDESRILTASSDNTARVWDALTGKEIQKLEGHTNAVNSAVFSSDESRILTASRDSTARVWDALTGKEIQKLEGHTNPVISAVFSGDGSRVLTTSIDDGTARVWDALTGKEIQKLEGHTETVLSAVFSSDESRILTASSDNTARVWDAASGEELTRLEGHTYIVSSAVFSNDESRILTASSDNTARVWDAVGGKVFTWREEHNELVIGAFFDRDGARQEHVASDDMATRIWRAHAVTQKLVDTAKARVPRCLTQDQRKTYFLPPAPPLWCVERKLWPYHTEPWQKWLVAKKAGKNPELPSK